MWVILPSKEYVMYISNTHNASDGMKHLEVELNEFDTCKPDGLLANTLLNRSPDLFRIVRFDRRVHEQRTFLHVAAIGR